jgi:hypothetical protein
MIQNNITIIPFKNILHLSNRKMKVTDLYQGSKMIIFGSILTTLIVSGVFRGRWGSSKNWPELKIEPPLANLACLNQ